jgi:hypothetical protein
VVYGDQGAWEGESYFVAFSLNLHILLVKSEFMMLSGNWTPGTARKFRLFSLLK